MLKEMLSEGSKISSKRVTGFVLLILIVLSVLCEQLFGLKLDADKFQYLIYLEEVCLGTIVLEKFSKFVGRKDKNSKADE